MRIGMMCHASFGGSARIGVELVMALARRKHCMHLFTLATPQGYWDPQLNIVLHTLKHTVATAAAELDPTTLYIDWPEDDIQYYTEQLLRVITAERLDAVHYHYAVPFAFVAQRLRDRLGDATPRLIGTLHGTDVYRFGKEPEMGPRLARALQSCDVITTVSKTHAELATSVLNLARPPCVVANFIDLSRFQPSPCRRANRPVRPRPRLIHISNFRPIKDPCSMAHIFLGIRARLDAELWLIGDGEEMAAVRTILQHSAYAEDVRYLGLQSDIPWHLRQADLLLMTSHYESFCLVALEAMACGVPVLATCVGGLPEVVVHGCTGLLFPPGEHERAVEMAVRVLSSSSEHRAMRQAAIRHARQYGVERIVPAYERLYQS
jgi:N-acetyl-alpha-D-glucosaminyl L-malate synthase BshA